MMKYLLIILLTMSCTKIFYVQIPVPVKQNGIGLNTESIPIFPDFKHDNGIEFFYPPQPEFISPLYMMDSLTHSQIIGDSAIKRMEIDSTGVIIIN